MGIKIIFKKNYYTREERTEEGFLVSRREYENKYLGGVMQYLVEKAEPDRHEKLLEALRKSYKLFSAQSIEFTKK